MDIPPIQGPSTEMDSPKFRSFFFFVSSFFPSPSRVFRCVEYKLKLSCHILISLTLVQKLDSHFKI